MTSLVSRTVARGAVPPVLPTPAGALGIFDPDDGQPFPPTIAGRVPDPAYPSNAGYSATFDCREPGRVDVYWCWKFTPIFSSTAITPPVLSDRRHRTDARTSWD